MKNLLQFTINVRKPNRQPQCTLQLFYEDANSSVAVTIHKSDTCSYEGYSSQWPKLTHSEILTFPPESPST